jgi:hypothetical protein
MVRRQAAVAKPVHVFELWTRACVFAPIHQKQLALAQAPEAVAASRIRAFGNHFQAFLLPASPAFAESTAS